MLKNAEKAISVFGTFCTASIHNDFLNFEANELRCDPRVDILESNLGDSHCNQNKQLMAQDIIESLKYQIQTGAHQKAMQI